MDYATGRPRLTDVLQIRAFERSCTVNARIITASDDTAGGTEALDLMFRAHYDRVARAIGRVIRDQARAEELAVDVFLKWWRHPAAHSDHAEGWIYRTAIRHALDELRRFRRRQRVERLLGSAASSPATPEHVYATSSEQQRVQTVLASLRRRDAEALLLRHAGLSYRELAAALKVDPAYVGSLLVRAQHAFRKAYDTRYGQQP